MQYFLIVLVAVFPKSKVISAIIPFNEASRMVFSTMMNGDSFIDFSAINYGTLIGNSLLYFILGLLIFNQCVKIAKSRGLLGQY